MGLFDFMGDASQPGLAGGLLGGGNWSAQPGQNDAIRRALLTTGLGLLGAPGGRSFSQSLGQAGLQGLGAYDDAQQQQRQQKMQDSQQQLHDFQFKQMQDAEARQKQQQQFIQTLPSPEMQSSQQALAGGGGPTVSNAQKIAPVDPQQNQMWGLVQNGLMKPEDYYSATRKDNTPITLPEGALLATRGGQTLLSNPKDKTPPDLRALASVYGEGSPEYIKAARDYATKISTHQPATKVEVNTGQKGLDNELKIRSDFRSEPVYKAHQEMQSAYSQIQQSLKQGTPAGDLAGATKIMKLLDPGSVVRESELGMAMAATGLLDRVQNYASNIVTGNKLNAKQRTEFQSLADALYGESVKQFNAKRSEYDVLGSGYNMNTDRLLGPSASMPAVKANGKTIARTGTDANGKKVVQYSDGSIDHAD
jgi:hypothetical protein